MIGEPSHGARSIGALFLCCLLIALSWPQGAGALDNSVRVARDQVYGTGAVYLFLRDEAGDVDALCSGMMVTRRWVLAAGHCRRAAFVRQGNKGDPNLIQVDIDKANVRVHPDRIPRDSDGNLNGFDVALFQLVTPIYPSRADGRRWEDYRRDVYRGSRESLENKAIDVYGYGATELWDRKPGTGPKGDGLLRFGKFEIVHVESI